MKPRRRTPGLDPLLVVLLGLPAEAFFGVLAWYRPVPPVPFPRQPAEFRSPDRLTADEARWRSALEDNPEDLTALEELARLEFERGSERYVAALEHLERARDLGSLDDRLNYYAGVMYDAKGLGEYAAPEFERFLRRHPDDKDTRLRLANLYYRMDELDKAIAAYQRVLTQSPGDPLVSFNLSLALRDRQKFQEGLDLLRPFLERGPALPPGGLKVVGDLHRGLKDPEIGRAHV
jgi:tetratricopeptide (TPR) repeat protein